MNYDIKGEAFYIPDSIICAKVNGRDAHILGVSETSLRLRIPPGDAPSIEELAITYYDFTENAFASLNIDDFETVTSEEKEFYTEKLIIVKDNKLFSDVVRDIVKGYYRYIKLKTESADNSYSKELTGYPAELDGMTPDSYDEWLEGVKEDSEKLLKKVLSLNSGDELVAGGGRTVELAVAYERADELLDILDEIADSGNSEEVMVSRAQRYYVGSAFCHRIYPTVPQLEQLVKYVKPVGKNITLVISFLRDAEIDVMEDYFMDLLWILEAYDFNIEVEVNDFGYLAMFSRMGESFNRRITPILGPLLNKRRKDPRYKYKWGISGKSGEHQDDFGGALGTGDGGLDDRRRLLARNQTNSAEFVEYLASYGVKRFEYESCGYRIELPEQRKLSKQPELPKQRELSKQSGLSEVTEPERITGHSLHLPVYQTNTSESCTLHAACTTGKRGAQKEAELKRCPEYCRDYFFAYPLHTGLIGRGNSIFAVDSELMENPELLEEYLEAGVDRIIWNL